MLDQLKELAMRQDDFRDLLYEVWSKSSSGFSGIGIVVCEDAAVLPIVDLRDTSPVIDGGLIETLSSLSSDRSKYHDGFHILNKKGELIHVAQYFSPPIVKEAHFDRSRLVGGRFVVALFGSSISGVDMTGIVSDGHGLSIFKGGKEVYFEGRS
ncbi:hypothetical protein AB835_14860 [Candidatus Endobugula sertula]|uniref:DAC domain-containing protein n=1 Tax=Candidatus Endobugula sertula TaxID=62101 RepID=A0A1D2QL74_9GAMM|nr:hypothetical protein AB835_14860 [Candidatus Endobugula sertula]